MHSPDQCVTYQRAYPQSALHLSYGKAGVRGADIGGAGHVRDEHATGFGGQVGEKLAEQGVEVLHSVCKWEGNSRTGRSGPADTACASDGRGTAEQGVQVLHTH